MIKQELYDLVQNLQPLCTKMCRTLWNNPEVGGTEAKSSSYLKKLLEQEGFAVTVCPNLPYAFCAEYGSGSPVLAVLAEYDALPGLSQKACAVKEPAVEGGPGHGCGHNLLGSAAMTAAIALKRYLEKSGTPGTVRLYGCPEEELLDGKIKMIAEHFFDGCDAALTWHPADSNMVHDRGYLANTAMKFSFSGRTSHAAFAPQLGRSALDAVELMNVGVNYLREHVVDKTRIHYTTDSGGFAPNIVPDKAGSWYFVRAPKVSDVRDTARRVELVAQGAATMTETTVRVSHGYGCCEFKENNAFGDLAYANLIEADGPKYTEKEINFAADLQKTLSPGTAEKNQSLYHMPGGVLYSGVGERALWKDCEMTASSDTGDISYLMPACLFTTACWPIGVAPHTWQSAASAGTTIGEKAALYAAKVLSGIGFDLYARPELLRRIRREFDDRDDGSYAPILADADYQ